MGESYVDSGRDASLHSGLNGGIEAGLLNAQLVGAGGQVGEFTVPGEVGSAAQWEGWRRRLQLHTRGGDGYSVLVGYGDRELLDGSRVLRRDARRRLRRRCLRAGLYKT